MELIYGGPREGKSLQCLVLAERHGATVIVRDQQRKRSLQALADHSGTGRNAKIETIEEHMRSRLWSVPRKVVLDDVFDIVEDILHPAQVVAASVPLCNRPMPTDDVISSTMADGSVISRRRFPHQVEQEPRPLPPTDAEVREAVEQLEAHHKAMREGGLTHSPMALSRKTCRTLLRAVQALRMTEDAKAARASVDCLAGYIDNPSAWETFDQSVSDAIAETVEACRAAFSSVFKGQEER